MSIKDKKTKKFYDGKNTFERDANIELKVK